MVSSLHHNSIHAMTEEQEGSHSCDIKWREEHGEIGSETTTRGCNVQSNHAVNRRKMTKAKSSMT